MTPTSGANGSASHESSGQAARQAEIFERYMTSSISTAPPATMLTMLYDALCDDLRASEKAFDARDIKGVNDSLVHAQQIIIALRDSLRLDLWEGAKGLASLYDFLLNELIAANVNKDRQRARACSGMIAQLAAAWHQAASSGESASAAHGAAPAHDARITEGPPEHPDDELPATAGAGERRSVINEVA